MHQETEERRGRSATACDTGIPSQRAGGHAASEHWLPFCSVFNQLLVTNVLGKAAEDRSSPWAPNAHGGDWDGVSGSWWWLWPL